AVASAHLGRRLEAPAISTDVQSQLAFSLSGARVAQLRGDRRYCAAAGHVLHRQRGDRHPHFHRGMCVDAPGAPMHRFCHACTAIRNHVWLYSDAAAATPDDVAKADVGASIDRFRHPVRVRSAWAFVVCLELGFDRFRSARIYFDAEGADAVANGDRGRDANIIWGIPCWNVRYTDLSVA